MNKPFLAHQSKPYISKITFKNNQRQSLKVIQRIGIGKFYFSIYGRLLFFTTIILTVIGVFILYESSSYTALLNIGDKYSYVKNQIVWAMLGVIVAVVVSQLPKRFFHLLALPSLLVTIALLAIVFLPGIGLELKGANRWIDLGFFVIQPSELLKVSLSVYLAAWLSQKEKGRLLAFLILFSLCVGLVVLEPDMGSASIIAVTAVVIYFLSNAKIKEILLIFLILIAAAVAMIKLEPYRVERFLAFKNFDSQDLSSSSYHIRQVLIALGNGGFAGAGIGNSIQKYAYLPENTTDSIFAIYAEETGFLGSVFLISLIVIQMILGFAISVQSSDNFSKLLAAGIVTFMSAQTIFNLASQAVLMPLTGVPLPFISYGGSSMIINYISIGILLNISRQTNK